MVLLIAFFDYCTFAVFCERLKAQHFCIKVDIVDFWCSVTVNFFSMASLYPTLEDMVIDQYQSVSVQFSFHLQSFFSIFLPKFLTTVSLKQCNIVIGIYGLPKISIFGLFHSSFRSIPVLRIQNTNLQRRLVRHCN